MHIDIIYEDNEIIVYDKPAGILAHPTLANEKNTISNYLLEENPEIINLPWEDKDRAGIVHRLDKDTSGIIVVAKNPNALKLLQDQFKNRDISKKYIALCQGRIEEKEGEIVAAITRGDNGLQKIQEQSYSFDKNKTREAVTKYRVLGYYSFDNEPLTLVEAMPQTGRMHQIRVHLKHIGHPIIGDQLYDNKISRKVSDKLKLNRQFLHATEIDFNHPQSNKLIHFTSDLHSDLKGVLEKLTENE